MPFLQLATSHIAQNHFLSGIGLSSKIVPTFTENCLRHSRHVHRNRVLMNDRRLDSQRGQAGPRAPHLASFARSKHTWGSEKCSIAPCNPSGILELNSPMNQAYSKSPCESSRL